MKFKALICDLDGTLLDTVHSIAHFMNETLKSFGIEPCRDGEYNYYAGNGAIELTRRALKSKGISDDSLTARVYTAYKEAYDNDPLYKTEIFPGIAELIASLKKKGVLLGVISNKPHSAVLPIVKHFFGEVFDIILGQSDTFPLKPDAALGVYATEKLGVLPSETVFIGDTGVDIEFARAFGAGLSVGVLWGFRDYKELKEAGADMIISEAKELLEVFL
jgi:phosphoglycolate phosphatase